MPARAHLAPHDDPALEGAYRRARETFGYFWRELSWEQRRIVPGLGVAAVKTAFADGDVVEHLWLDVVGFDGVDLEAVVINEPLDLRSVEPGERVEIGLDAVEDWMFTVDDVLHGGHTVHVIRAGMGWRARRAHDKAWGLVFPDEVLLAHGQVDHPERLEDHPMAAAMFPQLATALQLDRSLATALDGDGFTLLHREAIAGNRLLVRALLAFGADAGVRSPHGLTAAEHAERLGWAALAAELRE